MCGIAGTVGARAPDPETLARMAAEMAHRGPDGQGIWHDESAGLAFRRLAIIDLDPRSDQPLHFGPLHLVFNGEIYNYRELRAELRAFGHEFVTEGDGEVLLHAWAQWGEQALPRLNGMFAFAVWDERRCTLTAACDPFGEKPLFWAQQGERLLFASDIRAILRVAPELCAPRESALGGYLARGLMPAIDQSFFAAIERLPGAHVLRWAEGRVRSERWWHPRPVETPRRYEDAVAELRELLLDSIRLRLRSDVPVGTSLSGGVDSSAVVALSARLAGDHRRHAFTARFPGFERDEWGYASAVAAAAGVLEHHAVEPRVGELLEDLGRLISSHEEPVGSSSVYAQYRVMRAAHEAGVTVLLDGQGADELFGGYRGSGGWALRSEGPLRELQALARGGQERGEVLLSLGAERLPRALAARHRMRQASPYVSLEVARAAARLEPATVDWAQKRGPLVRELARQAFHTSMPVLLRYADRNSMAHSREVRLPFLDRRVAEFAYSLPPGFLYREGTTKRVLRDAVRDIVPAKVLERREKVGFETPEARWLATPEAVRQIADALLDPGARCAAMLDRGALGADARAGSWRDPNAIWRALNLELWLGAFAGPADAEAPRAAPRAAGAPAGRAPSSSPAP
jgi:asparagine synthase (glutamine-hydrolysing)